jgi:hypothetical protein
MQYAERQGILVCEGECAVGRFSEKLDIQFEHF